MPPSSSRLGPGPHVPPTGPQVPSAGPRLRVRRPAALSCVLAVVVPAAPAAAADREIFLTTEPPAEPPADGSILPTGPSGQVSPGPTPAPAPEAPAPGAPAPSHADHDADPSGPRLGPGGEIRVFGGMHQPTFGVALAFDYAFRRAALGVEADYAAWLSFDELTMHPGAIHFAAVGLHRIPLGRLSLRQRLALGPAILLADFGPHRAGATGLFFEAAPLGLEVHTRITRVTFVLDAFSLALSAPVLGAEFVARFQYRATIGLRF